MLAAKSQLLCNIDQLVISHRLKIYHILTQLRILGNYYFQTSDYARCIRMSQMIHYLIIYFRFIFFLAGGGGGFAGICRFENEKIKIF